MQVEIKGSLSVEIQSDSAEFRILQKISSLSGHRSGKIIARSTFSVSNVIMVTIICLTLQDSKTRDPLDMRHSFNEPSTVSASWREIQRKMIYKMSFKSALIKFTSLSKFGDLKFRLKRGKKVSDFWRMEAVWNLVDCTAFTQNNSTTNCRPLTSHASRS